MTTHVAHAGNVVALELAAVKTFNGSPQIRGSLKLDKTRACQHSSC